MTDNLMTIEQLAQRLAMSPKALRQRLWRAPATLPATVRIGKLVRFSAASVEAWIAAQRADAPRPERGRGRPRKTAAGHHG